MSKYQSLQGFEGVRVRLERRDRADGAEQIALLADASPYVRDIVAATARLDSAVTALRDRLNGDDSGKPIDHLPEVIMFHGTFVRTLVWCAKGATSRLGVK